MLPELLRIIIFDWFGFGLTQFCPYDLQWDLFQVSERPKNKIIFPRRWQIHVTRPKLEERVIRQLFLRGVQVMLSAVNVTMLANTHYTIKLLECLSDKEQTILSIFLPWFVKEWEHDSSFRKPTYRNRLLHFLCVVYFYVSRQLNAVTFSAMLLKVHK